MTKHSVLTLMAIGLLVSIAVGTASADIADDLANSTLVENFYFDDADGTLLDAAANSVTAHLWDDDADTATVATDGLGNLDASLKNNTGFGTNYVDTDTFNSGRWFGVMELTWDFQSTLDPAENEEIRLSLIGNDPRGTVVTAEWQIVRTDDDELVYFGNALGTDATGIPEIVLNGGSLTQSAEFIGVVDADLSHDRYSVYYSNDGGSSFTTLGSGILEPTRGIESLRMTLNNDLSGDNILIDRVYLSRYVPEPTSFVLMGLGLGLLAACRRRL